MVVALALPRSMFGQSPLGEGVKPPRAFVMLDLGIPVRFGLRRAGPKWRPG
jgi:hypothetical protein